MSLFPWIIYYIGDFNCHQKHYRSFILNGNQMPVCARDTGIFLGMNCGFIISLFVVSKDDLFDTAVQFLLNRLRDVKRKKVVVALIGIGLLLLIAIDGFLQFSPYYESTNAVRLITSILAGIFFASLISTLILAILEKNNVRMY